MIAAPADFVAAKLYRIDCRDMALLCTGEPILSDEGGSIFARVRHLEPLERWAWGAENPRLILGILADEGDSGGKFVRSLLLLPDDVEALPETPAETLELVDRCQVIDHDASRIFQRWSYASEGGAA